MPRGRPGAFDVIVERHRRAVYQLCYRFVGNHEDASDLSQDVFLRAYRGLAKFRGGRRSPTWLYRIGVNVCLNRVGDRKRSPDEPSTSASTWTRAPSRPPIGCCARSAPCSVREAIAQLPPKQRATLILRMYHELSHEEIAGVLGSSVGAVKANFFHALGNLKKLLGDGARIAMAHLTPKQSSISPRASRRTRRRRIWPTATPAAGSSPTARR